MKRIALAVVIASGSVVALYAQGPQPRPILFDTFRPIVSRIVPGDQRIVVMSAKPVPDVAWPGENEFIATIVQENPIIFTGRVIDKQPVFLRLFGQKSTEVSTAEANWIGSRITVLIDRIIQTVDEFPLTLLQRLAFADEGEGSATVNGVRIETETPWLDPIEPGRRYLISARIRGGAFYPTGMWMEPASGGSLQSRFRGSRSGAVRGPKTAFDDWTIDDATESLEVEIQRRRPAR